MISQRLLDSKVVVESLLLFWKEYNTIEENYAKSLKELLGTPAAGFKSSILRRFTSFFDEDSNNFEEGKYVYYFHIFIYIFIIFMFSDYV